MVSVSGDKKAICNSWPLGSILAGSATSAWGQHIKSNRIETPVCCGEQVPNEVRIAYDWGANKDGEYRLDSIEYAWCVYMLAKATRVKSHRLSYISDVSPILLLMCSLPYVICKEPYLNIWTSVPIKLAYNSIRFTHRSANWGCFAVLNGWRIQMVNMDATLAKMMLEK